MRTIQRLLFAVALLWSTVASAAVLTNADVVKMFEAKLDESIIISAIENSEPKFDTTADGLIELAKAKVPQTLLAAMIKRASGPAKPAAPAATSAAADTMLPSEVLIVDGDSAKPMRYLSPQMRTAARGLGFGGVASYAVLTGASAGHRTRNGTPSFVVSVPEQAQPESYVTMASFAVRGNNSREVLVGGGYMSYSTGIHPDRIVAVASEKAPDQSRAQRGFVIYKVTPKTALKPGEYAVILYTGEMRGLVGGFFAGGGNSFYDFGIDP